MLRRIAPDRLELEASCELHLTLTEQRAVGAGSRAEWCVEGQSASRQVVDGAVDGRHLRAIEDVKAFNEDFKLVRSVILNRRESRASTYQMFGCLKKLRGMNAKRVAPPEPFTPP